MAVVVPASAVVGFLGAALLQGVRRRSPAPTAAGRGPRRSADGPTRPGGARSPEAKGLPTRFRTGRHDLGVAAPTRWATAGDLRPLTVRRSEKGRLVLGGLVLGGLVPGSRRLLAGEVAQSVAIVGPTQSGKTSSVAVPAILAWEGPVLAASVKTDLVRDTIGWRRRCGRVWCFDPAGTTGLPASSWTPLATARTWPGARQVAADLTDVTRSDATTADGEFWYATAAKLLAPLLFAAATGGRTMHDVVRWVDTQEIKEVSDLLHRAGVPEALQTARATWLRDERQRSAVYTTAETVLEPFAVRPPGSSALGHHLGASPGCSARPDIGPVPLGRTPPLGTPVVGRTADVAAHALTPVADDIEPMSLLLGDHTLYLCAPAHDQRRLRALFVAVVQQVLHAAFALSSRRQGPLDPPLLVVLDEAANIAPLRELDGLAATCAGHGIQLVTVWQDLAQVRARYGERAPTVVNNHRAKVFLPGIADPGTLDFACHLAGETEVHVPSVTVGSSGERTVTSSPVTRRLLPPDSLRRLRPGTGVLLYGSLPPARLALRPWFCDPVLAARGGVAAGSRDRRPSVAAGPAGAPA